MRTILARLVLSLLGGWACALIASIPPASPAMRFPVRVGCGDLAAPAGEPVRARVKLERIDGCGMYPDIPNESIVFRAGDDVLASSYTNESGWATAELDLGPGLHEVRIAMDSLRYHLRPVGFRALVLREGERLLVLAFDDPEAASLLRARGRVASFGRGGDITLSREEAMRLGERVIALVKDESESSVWRASGAQVLVWKNGVPAKLDGLLKSPTER